MEKENYQPTAYHKRFGLCIVEDYDSRGMATIIYPEGLGRTTKRVHSRLLFEDVKFTKPFIYSPEFFPVKIEKDIPLPLVRKRLGRIGRYPTHRLEVDESYLFRNDVSKHSKILAAAHQHYINAKHSPKEFTWDYHQETIRIWRTK